MPQRISIERLDTATGIANLLPQIDAIFFQTSNTQSFADQQARDAFHHRWLGQYLSENPRWAYIAVTPEQTVAGYLAGSLQDPSVMAPFAHLAYWPDFKPWTKRYPAHLHVNIAPEFRSRGLGTQLITEFADDAAAAGADGMHVITGRTSRNVEFYRRNGFTPRATSGVGASAAVLLVCDFAHHPR